MLHIALLRSIVLGPHRVKMADARRIIEAIGGTDVASTGATGNLVFRSRKGAERLEREIEAGLAGCYGRSTEVVVKTAAQWRALMAANPFAAEAERAPAHVLVWAMRSPLPDAGLAQLQARAHGPEDGGEERVVRTASGDLYMWFGAGKIANSRLPSGFGLKSLGAVGTNRNWNTAMRITALLDAAEARRS